MILLEGWIFDVYNAGREMVVWMLDKQGEAHHLRDTFMPSFHVGGDPKDLRALAADLLAQPWGTTTSFIYRHDPSLNHRVLVLQVQVRDPNLFDSIFRHAAARRPDLAFYDGDLPLAQMYLREKQATLLAFCRAAADDDNHLYGLEVDDSPGARAALLPLKQMTIRFAGDAWHPICSQRGPLEVATEDTVRVFDQDKPKKMLNGLHRLLLHHNPDLIVTGWGDAIVLPYLARLSWQYRIPLPLHRDLSPWSCDPAPSYFSYGLMARRVMHHRLRGRRHIDPSHMPLTPGCGTPPFIAAATTEMEKVVARARTHEQAHAPIPQLVDMARGCAGALRSGHVPYQELVITERLSRDPSAYPHDSPLALAAQELLRDGAAPGPGDSIQYILTEAHTAAGRDALLPSLHYCRPERYDAEKYVELLVRAVASVLAPLGISEQEIAKGVNAGAQKRTSGDPQGLRRDTAAPVDPLRSRTG